VKIHIVKQGDSLYSIAQKYGVSLEDVLKANPDISNPDAIDVGMLKFQPVRNRRSASFTSISYSREIRCGSCPRPGAFN